MTMTILNVSFFPEYSETNLKVGEPTLSFIPMADAKPCVNVVLPAPRFPISAMTLPIGIFSAINFAR